MVNGYHTASMMNSQYWVGEDGHTASMMNSQYRVGEDSHTASMMNSQYRDSESGGGQTCVPKPSLVMLIWLWLLCFQTPARADFSTIQFLA